MEEPKGGSAPDSRVYCVTDNSNHVGGASGRVHFLFECESHNRKVSPPQCLKRPGLYDL